MEAYWQYHKIVGDEVGDDVMTPEQYEKFKKEVLPSRMKNRLFVSWGVPGGIDCKLIGPETPCHCSHRYRQHQTDYKVLPESPVPIPCLAAGCRCVNYNYIPRQGTMFIRCHCRHLSDEHKVKQPHTCSKCQCAEFKSSFTCGCTEPAHKHRTLVETKAERSGRGMPVGQDVPYAAMGGLTGFSSLAEGYMRCDPSGAQPIPEPRRQVRGAEGGRAERAAEGGRAEGGRAERGQVRGAERGRAERAADPNSFAAMTDLYKSLE